MINKAKILEIFILLTFAVTPVLSTPVDDLQLGYWYEVPNSHLSQVYPDPIPEGYGPESIISTWNGGVFDTKRNSLIVWGGGHLDYAGNEVYAFSLDNLTWTRITDPSPKTTVCADYNPDGQPAMPHTYNSLQYLENTDRFVQAGGSSYGDGCPRYSHTNLLNMDRNLPTPLWERGQDHPVLGHTTGRISAYNSSTGYLWVHGTYSSQGAKLARYDPTNDSWASYGSVTNLDIYTTADIFKIDSICI